MSSSLEKHTQECNSHCIYYPDKKIDEIYIDKNGVKRIANSHKYFCTYINKPIQPNFICKKFCGIEDLKKFKKELKL